MDLVKCLTLLPWRQVHHPCLCLADVNVEKSKLIVITNSDVYVTAIRLWYGMKKKEISSKLGPAVYVMLYVRSLNHLSPEMFACLERDNPRNSCLFVKALWAQNTVQKSCGLLASVIVASFEPGFMFVRLDPVQTNSKQGGCSRSEQCTHGWLQSEPPAASPPSHWPLILFSASHFWDFSLSSTGLLNLFCLCVGVKKEYLPDTIKNMYLNLLIGLVAHLALVRLHWSNALHFEKVIQYRQNSVYVSMNTPQFV